MTVEIHTLKNLEMNIFYYFILVFETPLPLAQSKRKISNAQHLLHELCTSVQSYHTQKVHRFFVKLTVRVFTGLLYLYIMETI